MCGSIAIGRWQNGNSLISQTLGVMGFDGCFFGCKPGDVSETSIG